MFKFIKNSIEKLYQSEEKSEFKKNLETLVKHLTDSKNIIKDSESPEAKKLNELEDYYLSISIQGKKYSKEGSKILKDKIADIEKILNTQKKLQKQEQYFNETDNYFKKVEEFATQKNPTEAENKFNSYLSQQVNNFRSLKEGYPRASYQQKEEILEKCETLMQGIERTKQCIYAPPQQTTQKQVAKIPSPSSSLKHRIK